MPKSLAEGSATDLPERRLVDLSASIDNPIGRTVVRLITQPVERLLSLSALNRIYSDLAPQADESTFFATVLRRLRVGYDLAAEDVAKIPTVGPLVVVANHPFGG